MQIQEEMDGKNELKAKLQQQYEVSYKNSDYEDLISKFTKQIDTLTRCVSDKNNEIEQVVNRFEQKQAK